MDFNRVKIAFALIGILACLAVVFIAGRRSVHIPEIGSSVSYDTIRLEIPVPYTIEKVNTKYVYLPPVPNEGDDDIIDTPASDSTLVAVDIERRVYQDSSFRATISGPRIGEFHPILEDIEIYSKTNTAVMERPVRFIRPYISACGGKAILGIGGGIRINERVDIGAKYLRMNQKDAWIIETNIVF